MSTMPLELSSSRAATARVTVIAWRNRTKLLLRVTERLDTIGTGGAAGTGVDAANGADARNAAAAADVSIAGSCAGGERAPTKHVKEGRFGGRLLDEGGSVIVIHETEVTRLTACKNCTAHHNQSVW